LNDDPTVIYSGEPFVIFDLDIQEDGGFSLQYNVAEQSMYSISGRYYLDFRESSLTPQGPKTKGLHAIDFVPSLGTAGTTFKAQFPFCSSYFLQFSVEGLLDELVRIELRKK